MGIKNRRVLPLSQQSTGAVRGRKCPSPCTVASSAPVSTAAHSCAAADRVAEMSLLNSRWVMWERPTASAAHSTARCAMLLLGGAAITPPMPPGAGLMVTSIAVLSFCRFPPGSASGAPLGELARQRLMG